MKKSIIFLVLVGLMACKDHQKHQQDTNQQLAEIQPEKEIQEEWKILFDGTSFEGWKGYRSDQVPDSWKLEDGAMVFYPPEKRQRGENGNLVTVDDYTNFVLSLEWKISEGGNSGIFWGVKEDESFPQPYETGPEIQVLDNERHPDAKAGTTHQAGALYDMIAPSEDVTKPVGEWNSCEITIDHENNMGKVVLNGREIVNFPLANEQWDEMVSKSKFANWSGFGKYTTGKIGLQDHGDIVAFRNIKIKEL